MRSHNGRPRSAGVAVQTCLSIVQGNEIRVLPVASRMFHIPVTDIDVAERIGVLAGAYMIRCKADLILAIIKEERCVLEPSISLYTDRQCLLQTLPRCSAFKVLCDRLINQFGLEQQTGVLLLWERRESNFMQGIDRKAVAATKMTVCPMSMVFPLDFLTLLTRNPIFWNRIQDMGRSFRLVEGISTSTGASGSRIDAWSPSESSSVSSSVSSWENSSVSSSESSSASFSKFA